MNKAFAALTTDICNSFFCTPLLQVGLLNGADAAALRLAVNKACRQLGRGGCAAPALKLCDAFAIPEHLLAAPIAQNWREMGQTL